MLARSALVTFFFRAVKYFNPLTGLCILRCSRANYRMAWAAMTVTAEFQGQRVSVRSLHVGGETAEGCRRGGAGRGGSRTPPRVRAAGTIRSCQHAAIAYHRKASALSLRSRLEPSPHGGGGGVGVARCARGPAAVERAQAQGGGSVGVVRRELQDPRAGDVTSASPARSRPATRCTILCLLATHVQPCSHALRAYCAVAAGGRSPHTRLSSEPSHYATSVQVLLFLSFGTRLLHKSFTENKTEATARASRSRSRTYGTK
jgi:RNase P/RNase MRP subunit POP5